jgi:hypothetical protein
MESQQGRIGDQRFIYMEAVHRRYLFQKNIPLTLKNKVIFAWSRLGVFFVSLLRFIQKPGQFNINLLNLRYTIMGEWFAFRNRKRIAKGELGFFHQWFWKEQ